MKKSERLIQRLRRDGVITGTQAEGANVLRTYAGREMRSEGAWSWYLVDASGLELFTGSHYSLTELLKAPEWVYGGDGTIYPDPVPNELTT
jgi:hypothetical protein